MTTRTEAAIGRIDDCIRIYKTIGIIDYSLEIHPDFPGQWLLVLECDPITEEVFASLGAIWKVCGQEWPLAGIQVGNLKPLMRDSLDLVNEYPFLTQPHWEP